MSGPRQRTRTELLLPKGYKIGSYYLYNCNLQGERTSLSGTTDFTEPTDIYARHEFCADETHVPLHIKRPRYGRHGGPLNLSRTVLENALSDERTIPFNCWQEYRGRFRAKSIVSNMILPYQDSWPAEVEGYGPEGWNKFRPGRPEVSMGVFLGELRDLPKMLKQTCDVLRRAYGRLRRLGRNPMGLSLSDVTRRGGRELAQDYLLYQFGWAPLLSDIRKCFQTSQNVDRLLREIRSNNGRVRRRGGTLLTEKTTTVLADGPDWGAVRPTLGTQYYECQPTYRLTCCDERKVWFKGAFRYYVPDCGSLQWRRRTKRLLYGLTINAEVLWNLVPWTWLIDWFCNAGDIMASVDTGWADNLTTKYAYVMGYRRKTYTQTAVVKFAHAAPLRLVSKIIYENKQRRHASPYGFGVSFDSLSPRRVAILSALGITRLDMPSHFR